MLDLLDRLVAFNTVSDQSNLDLIDFAQDFLTSRGFSVTRLTDPAEPKAGLYAEIGPAGDGVLLSAHTDVVPVAGQVWTRDPFRLTVEGGRAYGRGTTDMKGFVAAMLGAADRASRMTLSAPLRLVLSYDEEIGCVGIARMAGRLKPLVGTPRIAIVGEPTGLQVATGHKGKRAYQAVIRGQAGHSALAPRFVNALNVASDFMQALQALQADLEQLGGRDDGYDIPYSTVHVGTLSGGRALNIVPDQAEMRFEFRHLAQDDPNRLDQRIRDAARSICATYGPAAGIEITQTSDYPGLATPVASQMVRDVLRFAGTQTTKVAFGTEAGVFTALGIPTVVCGPGSMEGQGHKADEYIALSELSACAAMLDRVLDDMAA
ncbi:acetylornithine deacetylase [Aliishimia ponticola]|uniref:Acetylornithine deacetylase n=1 Tax=Aliishimia ponticola TaxID=2499833 RepID=A0A4S4NHA3_9RHOB|nr:acetylornithine deacetylase [Aliishimia ponticola]THH38225.1 acetylornithine deacetylase [Aliishimia ponticola]